MRQKPKVIYIAGSGRSGSTMLSLLLSQHPQIANLGQIRDVYLARSKGAWCSCGALVGDCHVWGPVLSLRPLETRRLGTLPQDAVFAAYCEAFKATAAPVFVDSSKSVDLCRLLQSTSEVDLYCLNLIRDPRAVVVSWSKVLGNQDLLRKRCRNWVARQKRIEQLGQGGDTHYLLLRYEDFVRDPKAWVSRIQAWAGVTPDLTAFEGATVAHLSWDNQHLFEPANETVLRKRATRIQIAEAVAWKAAKHAQVRAMATEICFPFAKRYGYRLEDGL